MGYGDDNSIAAFATTPGNSALTLIRCSGNNSFKLFSGIFSSDEKLLQAAGNTIIHGWILLENEKIDEVLVSVFRTPKSYTGEDSLDISCHGGIAAGKAVMETLLSAGFREALPGEFTFRAFMNGKLDLTKSESVMELVSSKTDAGRRRAMSRLCGSLLAEINEIKQLLVQVLAGAEIYLDYSEDEISADTEEAAGKLPNQAIAHNALARLGKLANSRQLERIYQEGLTAVIAGRPNAGKSSLFNAMLKEDRSIVTEIPGTTRDWIEAWCSIKGIPLRLIDTAGIRETSDQIEKIGVERSFQHIQEAHIILYLIDCTQGITDEDKQFITEYGTLAQSSSQILILLWNKSDIAPQTKNISESLNILYLVDNAVSISAKTSEGIEELNNTIIFAIAQRTAAQQETADQTSLQKTAERRRIQKKLQNETLSPSLGTERQKKLVDSAYAALKEALVSAEREEPLDLIAPLIREAVNSLGEITGEVSTADILEEMFSQFCVGK